MDIPKTVNPRRGWMLISRLCFVAMVPILVACGGSASKDKGALKLRIDETYVANVPEREQAALRQANSDLFQARRKLAQAKAASDSADSNVKIAKYELERAVLATRAAEVGLRAARRRASLREIKEAETLKASAVARGSTAEAKLQHKRATLAYWKEEVRYRNRHMHAMEAKYELEKALLAQRHQIQPDGFVLERFEQQYHQRMALAKASRIHARERRLEADSANASWLTLKRRAEEVDRNGRLSRRPAAPAPEPGSEPVQEQEPQPVQEPQPMQEPEPAQEPQPAQDPVLKPGPAFESKKNSRPE